MMLRYVTWYVDIRGFKLSSSTCADDDHHGVVNAPAHASNAALTFQHHILALPMLNPVAS